MQSWQCTLHLPRFLRSGEDQGREAEQTGAEQTCHPSEDLQTAKVGVVLAIEDGAHDGETSQIAARHVSTVRSILGLRRFTDLNPMTVWNVPNLTPSVSRVPVFAAHGMSRETKAPLAKPYTSPKTMMPACEGW